MVPRPKILGTSHTKPLQNKGKPQLTERRREARRVVSQRLREVIYRAESSLQAVADLLVVDKRLVRRWCDPDDTRTIPDGDLEVVRRAMPRARQEYQRMEREADSEALPGLDDEQHDARLMRAVLQTTTADGINARTKALRKLLGYVGAALRDATGEDE